MRMDISRTASTTLQDCLVTGSARALRLPTEGFAGPPGCGASGASWSESRPKSAARNCHCGCAAAQEAKRGRDREVADVWQAVVV